MSLVQVGIGNAIGSVTWATKLALGMNLRKRKILFNPRPLSFHETLKLTYKTTQCMKYKQARIGRLYFNRLSSKSFVRWSSVTFDYSPKGKLQVHSSRVRG